MVVLASIIVVITSPTVEIPRFNGVTSSNTTSPTLLSPLRIAPWIAAPWATASSGLTPFEGSFPKNFFTASCTAGIRVVPPTRRISSISVLDNLALFKARSQGSIERLIMSLISCSNLARVSVFTRCLGTPPSAVI